MTVDSLQISLQHYYWKPGKACFHTYELDQYARADVHLQHPILDLGGGDGTFAEMLSQKGILDHTDVTLDYGAGDMARFAQSDRANGIRGDARYLPLPSRAFGSVLANGLFCSIQSDLDHAMSEVHRILVDGGLFVLTLPKEDVNEFQVTARLLAALGATSLRERYLASLNRRLDHHYLLSESEWRRLLEQASFEIETVRPFFTSSQAFWANVLTLQAFRIFSLLRLFRSSWLARQVIAAQVWGLSQVIPREPPLPQAGDATQTGWLLIVARKKLTQNRPQ